MHRACERCGLPGGTLALLTSMVAYFVCGQCGHRWRVAGAEAHIEDRAARTPA